LLPASQDVTLELGLPASRATALFWGPFSDDGAGVQLLFLYVVVVVIITSPVLRELLLAVTLVVSKVKVLSLLPHAVIVVPVVTL